MHDIVIDKRITPFNPAFFSSIDAVNTSTISTVSVNALLNTSQKNIEEMQMVARYMENNEATAQSDRIDPNLPELTPPELNVAEQVAEGKANSSLFALIAQLMEIFASSSIEGLKTRLKSLQVMAEARRSSFGKMTEEIEKLTKDLGNAKEIFEKSKSDLIEADKKLKEAENLLKDAELVFAETLAKYRAAESAYRANPNKETAAAWAAVRTELETREKELEDAKKLQPELISIALRNKNEAQGALLIAVENVNRIAAMLNEKINQQPPSLPGNFEPELDPKVYENAKSAAAILTEIMLMLQKLIYEDSEAQFGNRLKIYQEQQAALQIELKNKADEVAEAQRKMEEVNKIIKPLAIGLGILGIIVGILGAIPTGGASIAAVAGIVLGLATVGISVADTVYEIKGETGPTAHVMNFLMEKTIKPLFELIKKSIEDNLARTRPDLTAEQRAIEANIGAALATGVIVLAVVLAAVATGKVASMGADKLMKLTQLGDKLPKLFDPLSKHAAMSINYLSTGSSMTIALGTAAEISMSIVSAIFQKQGGDAMAKLNLDKTVFDNITKYVGLATEQLTNMLKLETNFAKRVSDILAAHIQSIHAINQNMAPNRRV